MNKAINSTCFHLLNIIKNANSKLNELTKVQKYMTTEHKNLIFSSFIKSQLTYCPLLWMFCSKHSLVEKPTHLTNLTYLAYQTKLNPWFWNNFRRSKWKMISLKIYGINWVYKYFNDIINTTFKLRWNIHKQRIFHIFESQNRKTKIVLGYVWH